MKIDPVELGKRWKSAREAAQITQENAAKDIGISRPTLIAVEQGRRNPKREEIQRMLVLYGVSAGEVYQNATLQVAEIQPHLRAAMGSDSGNVDLQQAIALLTRHVDNLAYIETLMGVSHASSVPEERPIPANCDVKQFAESVAVSERARLGLGNQPIIDLRQLLDEEAGVRIFYGALASRLAGVYAYVPTRGYFILVNRKHPPVRRRWTTAHEYGHFLSERHEPGVDYVSEPSRKSRSEQFADAFAAEFLMPRSGIERSFYATIRANDNFYVADLCRLANRFFVSLQAMTLRLEQLGLLARGAWQKLRDEKFQPERTNLELGLGNDSHRSSNAMWPESYEFLAIQAFNDEKISIGKLARLFDTDIIGARERVELRSQMSQEIDESQAWGVQIQEPLLDGGRASAG